MNNKQNKKPYIKPQLSSLGSVVELTLQHPGNDYSYSYSHSSSYSQAGGKPGHHMMS